MICGVKSIGKKKKKEQPFLPLPNKIKVPIHYQLPDFYQYRPVCDLKKALGPIRRQKN